MQILKQHNQTFEIALWLPSFADVDSEYERLSKLDVQLVDHVIDKFVKSNSNQDLCG